MRSLQLINLILTGTIPASDINHYRELEVLSSGAGWYVGTLYQSPSEEGFLEPGSRDTAYFIHRHEAEDCLSILTALDLSWAEEYATTQTRLKSSYLFYMCHNFNLNMQKKGYNLDQSDYRLWP